MTASKVASMLSGTENQRNLIFVASNPSPTDGEPVEKEEDAALSPATHQQQLADNKLQIRRLQVQVVHRHGDRSPITPLQDEAYWQSQLIPEEQLQELARNTHVTETDGEADTHKANGRGPFGKLTLLGLQQMVDLGTVLRQELVQVSRCGTGMQQQKETRIDCAGNIVYPFVCDSPLQPSDVRVFSTSFPRAIQSAQGVLQGLFPNDTITTTTKNKSNKIPIEARHTNRLLPDPQPRATHEQSALEDRLAAQPHLLAREAELRPLAVRVTQALHPLLAADAHDASFGAGQRTRPSEESIEVEPLAWNQLGEILKCLSCRNRLPPEITEHDHQTVVQHAAWRWYELFRHPRLAHLAMHEQCQVMVDQFCQPHPHKPVLTLYSAHDSTLIGLLCAFKLERPVEWPEYGSFLMMELLQVTSMSTTRPGDTTQADSETKDRLFVRFSLNGELLRSLWDDGDDEPADMILLDRLSEHLRNEGKATKGMS